MNPYDAATTPLEPGITLIEAAAGTGKTWSIAALFLRLVLEEHLPVREILAVTYTVAATAELRERIRARLQSALIRLRNSGSDSEPASDDSVLAHFIARGGDCELAVRELDVAAQSFDEARIFTIHGFCLRILQDHTFETGGRFGIEVATDAAPLFEEVAHDFWRSQFYNAAPHLAALALERGASPADWIELLKNTRNHPDLVILPARDAKSAAVLGDELAAALAGVQSAWASDRAGLEAILRGDKALLRNAKAFSPGRLDRLIPALGRMASVSCDVEGVEAILAFCTDAVRAGTGKNKVTPDHRFFERCQEFCELAERWFRQVTREFLDFAAVELPERKRRANVLAFDDLLTRVHQALAGPGGGALAARAGGAYRAALIDEFQDTDPLQYDIFRQLFAGPRHWLFFIGDPKQAIYGFRGADVFTYLKAAKSASRKYTLTTNWRSDEELLAGFNAVFNRRGDGVPFVVNGIEYYPVHASDERKAKARDPGLPAPLRFRYLSGRETDGKRADLSQEEASRRIAEAVAGDIAAAHEESGGGRAWGGMAVLVRKHRQAALIQAALREAGIRSVLHTEESVFHSQEARELQRLLEAVLAPADLGRLHAALLTPMLGQNANDIAGLTTESHQVWLERFLEWRELWRNACFVAMFRRELDGQEIRRRLMQWPGGERRLTNLLHLCELLHAAESELRLTPEALLEWLADQRVSKRPARDAAQLRLESDGDAVTIVTVHKSKGLEYPVVFAPFLWLPSDSSRRDRVQFHDAEGHLTLDLRGKSGADPADVERHRQEALAEEVRLLYVTVTRAKHECVIYAGDIKGAGDSSALGYLLECDGGRLLAGIDALVEGCGSAATVSMIEVREEGSMPRPAGEPGEAAGDEHRSEPEALAPRVFAGTLSYPVFLTSFTGLTAAGSSDAAADPPERDRHMEAVAAVAPTRSETEPGAPSVFTFERGTRAGEFLHEVLENLDFQDPAQLDPLLSAKLAAHGFPRNPWHEPLKEMLRAVLEVELEPGLRLSQISRQNRLSEAEFSFRLNRLSPPSLRALFDGFDAPALDPLDLGRLRFSPVEGFLRGFIDLLFHHEGKYYIVDWKSNWLGASPEDYDDAGVDRCMREHQYALQAHLYALAADRFLAGRLPDYQYGRHFGGVYYLFLRGIDPQQPRRAIHRGRPAPALMERLRRHVTLGEAPGSH